MIRFPHCTAAATVDSLLGLRRREMALRNATNRAGKSGTRYFNFTNNKTKIAHTPTVTGNCTNCASRTALPLGTKNVSPNIAKAVSIPRANLVLKSIVVLPR